MVTFITNPIEELEHGSDEDDEEPTIKCPVVTAARRQDISHILSAIGPYDNQTSHGEDLFENLLKSGTGSEDSTQQKFHNALIDIKKHYDDEISSIEKVERHILHAQTRLVSAGPARLSNGTDDQDRIIPKRQRHILRSCLSADLLSENGLLSPNDYLAEEKKNGSNVPKSAKKQRRSPITRTPTANSTRIKSAGPLELDDIDILKFDEGEYDDDFNRAAMVYAGKHDDRLPKLKPKKPKKNPASMKDQAYDQWLIRNIQAKTNFLRNPRFKELPDIRGTGSGDEKKDVFPFTAEPSSVVFNCYQVGKEYQVQLILRNVSNVMQQCRVLRPSTPYFSVSLGKYPMDNSLVAPGMTCVYNVHFSPDSLQEYEDHLTLEVTGNRKPMIISLMGVREPAAFNIPTTIDLGMCIFGEVRTIEVNVKNFGGSGQFVIIPAELWPSTSFKSVATANACTNTPFSIAPGVFSVDRNADFMLRFDFQPLQFGPSCKDFVFISDNCHIRYVTLCGTGVPYILSVEIPRELVSRNPRETRDAFATHEIRMQDVNLGMAVHHNFIIRNNVAADIEFFWTILKPHLAPLNVSLARPEQRVLELEPSFSIQPQSGTLGRNSLMNFKLTFCPVSEGQSHNTLFCVLPYAPSIMSKLPSTEIIRGESPGDTASQSSGANSMQIFTTMYNLDGSVIEDDIDNLNSSNASGERMSSIIETLPKTPQRPVAPIQIDIKGLCRSYDVQLQPGVISPVNMMLVGLPYKQNFRMFNNSLGPAAFTWESKLTDNYIIEIEPRVGLIDPGTAIDLVCCATATRLLDIDACLACSIEFCESPAYLSFRANVRGPDCTIDDADVYFGLIEAGHSGCVEIAISNRDPIEASWRISLPEIPSESSEPEVSLVSDGAEDQNVILFSTETNDKEDVDVCPSIFKSSGNILEYMTVSPSRGLLKPFESCVVKFTLTSPPYIYGIFNELATLHMLDTRQNKVVRLIADIQTPIVSVEHCVVDYGEIPFETDVTRHIRLCNQSLFKAPFEWQKSFSQKGFTDTYQLGIGIPKGVLAPREVLDIPFKLRALTKGPYKVVVGCVIDGMLTPIGVTLRAKSKGLCIQYGVLPSNKHDDEIEIDDKRLRVPVNMLSKDEIVSALGTVAYGDKGFSSIDETPGGAVYNPITAPPTLDFGKCALQMAHSRYYMIYNCMPRTAEFELGVETFTCGVEKIPKVEDVMAKVGSRHRAQQELLKTVLSENRGLALHVYPRKGVLKAGQALRVQVTAWADMWGRYEDNIICKIGDLAPTSIPVVVEASGSPLLFQIMIAQRSCTAVTRFGVQIVGARIVEKDMRILNEGPCDIRLEWKAYESVQKQVEPLEKRKSSLSPRRFLSRNLGTDADEATGVDEDIEEGEPGERFSLIRPISAYNPDGVNGGIGHHEKASLLMRPTSMNVDGGGTSTGGMLTLDDVSSEDMTSASAQLVTRSQVSVHDIKSSNRDIDRSKREINRSNREIYRSNGEINRSNREIYRSNRDVNRHNSHLPGVRFSDEFLELVSRKTTDDTRKINQFLLDKFQVNPEDKILDLLHYSLHPSREPNLEDLIAIADNEDGKAPRLLTLQMQPHFGPVSTEMFKMRPEIIMVPGRSHVKVKVSFDPALIPESVSHRCFTMDSQLVSGRALGTPILNAEDVQASYGPNGKVFRRHGHAVDPLVLGLAVTLQPCHLVIQLDEEDPPAVPVTSLFGNEAPFVKIFLSNPQETLLRFYIQPCDNFQLIDTYPIKVIRDDPNNEHWSLDHSSNMTALVRLHPEQEAMIKAGNEIDFADEEETHKVVEVKGTLIVTFTKDFTQTFTFDQQFVYPCITVNKTLLAFPDQRIYEFSEDLLAIFTNPTLCPANLSATLGEGDDGIPLPSEYEGANVCTSSECFVLSVTQNRDSLECSVVFKPSSPGIHTAKVLANVEHYDAAQKVVQIRGFAHPDEKYATS